LAREEIQDSLNELLTAARQRDGALPSPDFA
jgi:hypothetical protein